MVSVARSMLALSLVVGLAGCAYQSSTSPRSWNPRASAELDRPDTTVGTNDTAEDATADLGHALDRYLDNAPAAAQGSNGNWPAPVHDDIRLTFLRAEQLEYRLRDDGPDLFRWEVQGWHGTDYHKLWVKTEGEQSLEGASEGDVEVQALYSRLVAPFWDFQVGARYDRRWGPGPNMDRWFGVLGVQGFAPYEFETELALFVSDAADASVRLTATTDFLITQRLILQPRFETELALQEVPEFQVGQGVNYIELGLRLRYEFKREIAPYIGLNWRRSLGETEDLIRADDGQVSDLAFVFGISLWY